MKIYVVEMWNNARSRPRWEPTVGVALTRSDAPAVLARWRKKNPDDKFRLSCFVRVGK